MGLTQTEQRNEDSILKSEDTLQGLQGNIKQNNICIIGGTRKKRKKGTENLFKETVAKNILNGEGNRYPGPGRILQIR